MESPLDISQNGIQSMKPRWYIQQLYDNYGFHLRHSCEKAKLDEIFLLEKDNKPYCEICQETLTIDEQFELNKFLLENKDLIEDTPHNYYFFTLLTRNITRRKLKKVMKVMPFEIGRVVYN